MAQALLKHCSSGAKAGARNMDSSLCEPRSNRQYMCLSVAPSFQGQDFTNKDAQLTSTAEGLGKIAIVNTEENDAAAVSVAAVDTGWRAACMMAFLFASVPRIGHACAPAWAIQGSHEALGRPRSCILRASRPLWGAMLATELFQGPA